MREIKFRGKYKNEWVHGFLTSTDLAKNVIDGKALNIHRYAIDSYEKSEKTFISGDTVFIEPIRYYIDEKTVGQYTGLKDKNGVEIFEGDIVKTKNYCRNGGFICGYIEYNDEIASYKVRTKQVNYSYNIKELEVIGNIHDNPELLEVEE